MSDTAPNPNTTLFAAMMAAVDSYSVTTRQSSFDCLSEGDGLPETAERDFTCF